MSTELTTHHVTHDHHEHPDHPEPGEDFAPGKLAYADAMAGVHPRHLTTSTSPRCTPPR